MNVSRGKKLLILSAQLAFTVGISALYFTYEADKIAGRSNYFIAIALVPFVNGLLAGLVWYAVNYQVSLINRKPRYPLPLAHAVVSLLPTAIYLLVMSLPF